MFLLGLTQREDASESLDTIVTPVRGAGAAQQLTEVWVLALFEYQ